MKPVRLAVVDDSKFVRQALIRLLTDVENVTVIGVAATAEELLENLEIWSPDVITLDLNMPGMGGLAALDRIREIRPTPTIILSTHSGEGAPQTIEALSRGAADFIDKEAYSLIDFQALREVLVAKILAVVGGSAGVATPAAEEKESQSERSESPGWFAAKKKTVVPQPHPGKYDVMLVGASTGGPAAVEQLLKDVGGGLPVPVVVVQHMPKRFTTAFAERLNRCIAAPVCEAIGGEVLEPGVAYVAAGGQHLRLERDDNRLVAVGSRSPEDAAHHPSVDVLFNSAADTEGNRALAVLLTGMGKDGAHGMARLRSRGAHTIAQDEATCVVYGMPGAAVALNAAGEVLPLDEIGKRAGELIRGSQEMTADVQFSRKVVVNTGE